MLKLKEESPVIIKQRQNLSEYNKEKEKLDKLFSVKINADASFSKLTDDMSEVQETDKRTHMK